MSRRRFAAIGRPVAGAVLIDADMLTLVAGLAVLAAQKYAVPVACAINLGSPSRRRRWAADRLAGVGIMVLLALLWLMLPIEALAQTTQVVEYYHTDALGSVRAVTNQQGQVIRRHDFMPFGEEIQPTVPPLEKRLFTGKERDAETGLDYFGARYNASSTGRFTSPDPLTASARTTNPQTFNRYAYALNNPLRFLDPDGLEVPRGCAQDSKCTIVVHINVVWDRNANHGAGVTDGQRAEFERFQLARAKKDYGTSNIQLKVSYTEGTMRLASSSGRPTIDGALGDALNVVVSSYTPLGVVNTSGVDKRTDTAYAFINVDKLWNDNVFLMGNSTEHELGHNFRGDLYTPRSPWSNRLANAWLDAQLWGQSTLGISQQEFRDGLQPRRYAVPANPLSHIPKK